MVLVATDSSFDDRRSASKPILGDGLVLLGAALFAVSNVAAERLLGERSISHAESIFNRRFLTSTG